MGKIIEELIKTNENCIGCNKCIRVCSSTGACVSEEKNGKNHIKVDPNKCIACGACIDVCEHSAREFMDDTDKFFADLSNGKKISVLVAPAFKANYPKQYLNVLGGLKKLGVNRIINVSFGADITTWAYINYLKQNNFSGGISQPCPAVVAYIERHIPSLISKLFPVQSPLLCSAIYAKKYLGIEDDLAFLSPCIAKKLEIDDPNTNGYVSYNLTFDHFMNYFRDNNLFGEPCDDEIPYNMGCIYPTLGGLSENIKFFLGDSTFVRQMEGERRMYHYLEKNKELLSGGLSPYTCIDALNCSGGCLYGTGCEKEYNENDETLINLFKIKKDMSLKTASVYQDCITPNERLNVFNEKFKKLNLNDFIRKYTDKSDLCSYKIPSEEEKNDIFNSMDKFSEDERHINCSCCGYDSCNDMVTAIYNGFNNKNNCIYYLRREKIEQSHRAEIAEKANEAKDAFLSNVSHEIRTPINAVLGMNAMILQESSENNIIDYSKKIRFAGRTLLSIINDILDISKIESGRIELALEKYSMRELLTTCYVINENSIQNRDIKLNIDIDGEIPEYLIGDMARIRQILVNLLHNSIKNTEHGEVRLLVKATNINDKETNLNFKVIDTGIGISEEDLKDIFSKFNRFDYNKNKNMEGAGLGLALSKGFIECMNGNISIKSKLGVGTTVEFNIPQEIASANAITSFDCNYIEIDGKNDVKLSAPGCRVLVVDDVEMNLIILSELLKNCGMYVDVADSGKAALEKTKEKSYDVILLDYMMPDMDGKETLMNIHSQGNGKNHDTPIIVQTANAMRGTKENYLLSGFIDCIFKPIDPNVLYEMLAVYLPKNLVKINNGK